MCQCTILIFTNKNDIIKSCSQKCYISFVAEVFVFSSGYMINWFTRVDIIIKWGLRRDWHFSFENKQAQLPEYRFCTRKSGGKAALCCLRKVRKFPGI